MSSHPPASPGCRTLKKSLAIEECVRQALENGQPVLVAGFVGKAAQVLDGLGALDRVDASERFPLRRAAIEEAAARLLD